MGSRYLVIEFDDESSADALRAQINAATAKGKRFRVLGLFAKPGKLCTCKITTANFKNWPMYLGTRFGWWMCGECKRPRTTSHQLRNLLGVEEWRSPVTQRGRGVSSVATPWNGNESDYSFSVPTLSITLLPAKPRH